ncbi:DUF6796 family protein [Elusimicrobiota bacterium]
MHKKNNMQTKHKKIILLTGSVAIFAILIGIVSDIILYGHPISGAQFINSGLPNLLNVGPQRLFVGGMLGMVFIALGLSGFWQLYLAIKPAGGFLPLIFWFLEIYVVTMGASMHLSYTFYGEVSRAMLSVDPEISKYFIQLFMRAENYMNIFTVTLFVTSGIASIIFIFVVLTKVTNYPKWIVFVAPGIPVVAVMLIGKILPAPFGGYVSASYAYLGFLVTAIISTVVLYRREKLIV